MTDTSDENNDAVSAAEQIILGEQEQVNVEAIFKLMVMVGVSLNRWRELMHDEGGYSQEWVEYAASAVFHRFFPPFVPKFEIGHDHDD